MSLKNFFLSSLLSSAFQSSPIKLSHFTEIDHDAWERSINQPIYSEDLSIELDQHTDIDEFFGLDDQATKNHRIKTFEQIESFTFDNLQEIGTIDDSPENLFIETTLITDEPTTLDTSSHDDFIQTMNPTAPVTDQRSMSSTQSSFSSIHDTTLDPNELAFRLSRLDSDNIASPPKKTLADELAELGEGHGRHFENDSLDHTPPAQVQPTTIESPLRIDQLTTIVEDLHRINQEKSISGLQTIVEDIHAQTDNQHLTKIVDYHHSPPISNLQTIVTELQQIPLGKPVIRPQRPTHLSLDVDIEDEEEIESMKSSPLVQSDPISISSNLVQDLQQQLNLYKVPTPSSPVQPKRTTQESTSTLQSSRAHSQRIDKVSDLEIIKQGKGFKIGYVDRQGTDQRVILTKRIPAGPDVIARDPNVRLPYKGRKILNQLLSSVLYTNGHNMIQEDRKFQRILDDLEVPIIGTNPQHFDEVCYVVFFFVSFNTFCDGTEDFHNH